MPTTPEHSPKNVSIQNEIDINSNMGKTLPEETDQKLDISKDYYDRRKSDSGQFPNITTLPSSLQNSQDEQNYCVNCSELDKSEDSSQNDDLAEISSDLADDVNIKIQKNTETSDNPQLWNEFNGSQDNEIQLPKTLNNLLDDCNSKTDEVLKVPINEVDSIDECQSDGIISINAISINENNIKPTSDEVNNESMIEPDSLDLKGTVNAGHSQEVHIEKSDVYDKFKDVDAPKIGKNILDNVKLCDNLSSEYQIDQNPNQENKDISVLHTLIKVDKPKVLFDEFTEADSFADFSSFQSVNENFHAVQSISLTSSWNIPKLDETDANINDDFGDFVSTSSTVGEHAVSSTIISSSDNDFSDFQETSLSEMISIPSNPLEKAQQLFQDTFPRVENNYADYIYEVLEKDDQIFDLLKDVTDTPGLTYQWPKSSSQKLLLKALNIDERNIVSNFLLCLFYQTNVGTLLQYLITFQSIILIN